MERVISLSDLALPGAVFPFDVVHHAAAMLHEHRFERFILWKCLYYICSYRSVNPLQLYTTIFAITTSKQVMHIFWRNILVRLTA
jgi:hypothetical protein